ncbi:hypothetical protein BLNAU_2150 [Blattamonas nauphoetae]|uniref:Uncharacterized protein n=1 Tax=Blattamonas nauphoetae TaxID=2049346 RepID=A0ABQ9YG09_9EUKA|nr:hypothetical protein BLNAU_2150 [Blattamonas nauphoetae]
MSQERHFGQIFVSQDARIRQSGLRHFFGRSTGEAFGELEFGVKKDGMGKKSEFVSFVEDDDGVWREQTLKMKEQVIRGVTRKEGIFGDNLHVSGFEDDRSLKKRERTGISEIHDAFSSGQIQVNCFVVHEGNLDHLLFGQTNKTERPLYSRSLNIVIGEEKMREGWGKWVDEEEQHTSKGLLEEDVQPEMLVNAETAVEEVKQTDEIDEVDSEEALDALIRKEKERAAKVADDSNTLIPLTGNADEKPKQANAGVSGIPLSLWLERVEEMKRKGAEVGRNKNVKNEVSFLVEEWKRGMEELAERSEWTEAETEETLFLEGLLCHLLTVQVSTLSVFSVESGRELVCSLIGFVNELKPSKLYTPFFIPLTISSKAPTQKRAPQTLDHFLSMMRFLMDTQMVLIGLGIRMEMNGGYSERGFVLLRSELELLIGGCLWLLRGMERQKMASEEASTRNRGRTDGDSVGQWRFEKMISKLGLFAEAGFGIGKAGWVNIIDWSDGVASNESRGRENELRVDWRSEIREEESNRASFLHSLQPPPPTPPTPSLFSAVPSTSPQMEEAPEPSLYATLPPLHPPESEDNDEDDSLLLKWVTEEGRRSLASNLPVDLYELSVDEKEVAILGQMDRISLVDDVMPALFDPLPGMPDDENEEREEYQKRVNRRKQGIFDDITPKMKGIADRMKVRMEVLLSTIHSLVLLLLSLTSTPFSSSLSRMLFPNIQQHTLFHSNLSSYLRKSSRVEAFMFPATSSMPTRSSTYHPSWMEWMRLSDVVDFGSSVLFPSSAAACSVLSSDPSTVKLNQTIFSQLWNTLLHLSDVLSHPALSPFEQCQDLRAVVHSNLISLASLNPTAPGSGAPLSKMIPSLLQPLQSSPLVWSAFLSSVALSAPQTLLTTASRLLNSLFASTPAGRHRLFSTQTSFQQQKTFAVPLPSSKIEQQNLFVAAINSVLEGQLVQELVSESASLPQTLDSLLRKTQLIPPDSPLLASSLFTLRPASLFFRSLVLSDSIVSLSLLSLLPLFEKIQASSWETVLDPTEKPTPSFSEILCKIQVPQTLLSQFAQISSLLVSAAVLFMTDSTLLPSTLPLEAHFSMISALFSFTVNTFLFPVVLASHVYSLLCAPLEISPDAMTSLCLLLPNPAMVLLSSLTDDLTHSASSSLPPFFTRIDLLDAGVDLTLLDARTQILTSPPEGFSVTVSPDQIVLTNSTDPLFSLVVPQNSFISVFSTRVYPTLPSSATRTSALLSILSSAEQSLNSISSLFALTLLRFLLFNNKSGSSSYPSPSSPFSAFSFYQRLLTLFCEITTECSTMFPNNPVFLSLLSNFSSNPPASSSLSSPSLFTWPSSLQRTSILRSPTQIVEEWFLGQLSKPQQTPFLFVFARLFFFSQADSDHSISQPRPSLLSSNINLLLPALHPHPEWPSLWLATSLTESDWTMQRRVLMQGIQKNGGVKRLIAGIVWSAMQEDKQTLRSEEQTERNRQSTKTDISSRNRSLFNILSGISSLQNIAHLLKEKGLMIRLDFDTFLSAKDAEKEEESEHMFKDDAFEIFTF